MKKIIYLAVVLFLLGMAVSCEKKESNEVLIFTSSEDFRIEHLQNRLNEQFPRYSVTVNYMTTGSLAAKLKAEGTVTDCDIIGELDSAYLEGILDNLADLSSMNTSIFLDDLIPSHKRYLPFYRSSGSIIINESFLAGRNIPVPASYRDLLRSEYRGIISMPNPRSSGTGFFFLKNLVNEWGEDAAFEYFDRFAENVLQFTSSGSGPVNALIQGEVGIALGMTFHAVNTINRGIPLRIEIFQEGSPYMIYGMAMIRGKDSRQAVREVFDFYVNVLTMEDKELFAPEQVFKNQVNNIPNYPQNIRYANMRGIEDLDEKDRLLEIWRH